MGMSASTLRLTMLTARLSQLQFQGQQINQQRTMLSNESSALYNSLLTAEVPTAPDPSQFTRIKYKSGNTEIISYGQNASGPYSHNMTIKRPATKAVMSQSSYNNINITRSVDSAATDYNFIANINGVNRNLSLVGDKAKLNDYEDKLDTYENMQTIESQITDLSKKDKGDKVNASTQQNIKNALGLSFTDPTGDNEISQALKTLYNTVQSNIFPDKVELSTYPDTNETQKAAYNMAVALGLSQPEDVTLDTNLTQENMDKALLAINQDNKISDHLRDKLFNTTTSGGTTTYTLKDAYKFSGDNPTTTVSQNDITNKFKDLNDLEKAELANLLGEYANKGNLDSFTGISNTNYTNYTNYGKGVNSLYNIATGNSSVDANITNEEMINTLKALLTEVGGDGNASSAAYYTNEVQPAYNAYQSSCATPGLTNVGEGETLFTYEDDNGDAAYIYLPIERISEDIFQTTIDTAKVYENQVSYIEGETVAETVNANVTFDEEGMMTKATLDTGEVLTFEVETELDETAYNAAMVEYDYRVQKYEKELSDANAKLAKIQAQDQKLEVQLTQLETEQKAVQTEIDAVKAVRDKSIERGFRTFS